jgi:hypothetical protein
MALEPSRPEGCIYFSGERPGLSAYRAWKSAQNGLRANETLGARVQPPGRSSCSTNLYENVRIPTFVTESTQSGKLVSRAPLTVSAPSRMVALKHQGERIVASLRRNTPDETSAAIHRGCQR